MSDCDFCDKPLSEHDISSMAGGTLVTCPGEGAVHSQFTPDREAPRYEVVVCDQCRVQLFSQGGPSDDPENWLHPLPDCEDFTPGVLEVVPLPQPRSEEAE